MHPVSTAPGGEGKPASQWPSARKPSWTPGGGRRSFAPPPWTPGRSLSIPLTSSPRLSSRKEFSRHPLLSFSFPWIYLKGGNYGETGCFNARKTLRQSDSGGIERVNQRGTKFPFSEDLPAQTKMTFHAAEKRMPLMPLLGDL